ncbi:endo-1,4-beta-xylanase A precursor [bacterium BMS3Bbin01]|nr:endo-1,4-beta-xylanase A precursor [bacterium BMS3Bbin01]
MHKRLPALLAALTLVALLAPPAPASAAGDPYAADPLRLVPFADTVQQVYSQGTDTWEVWQCVVPDWAGRIDVPNTTDELNRAIPPYFTWLSDGQYTPRFVAGGTVTSSDYVPPDIANQESFRVPGCEDAVAAATSGTANGALIVIAGGFNEGYGTAGAFCPEDPYTGCVTTYPDNARIAVVGAAAVVTISPFDQPQWMTVAHEIGHGLNWPHSYGGLNTLPSGSVDTYDNPMDVMSGETVVGNPIGTIVYNRYAAGWIDSSQVVIHRSGIGVYTLGTIGTAGVQMIVLPLEEGHFYVLGTRRLSGYDAALPKAGVEVYEVDQRRTACSMPLSWPNTWPCFATLIRIAQTPAVTGINGTAHVLSIDEWIDLGSVTVTVIAADANSFTIRVEDTSIGNRFVDDDGNIHEANIEAIAAAGITNGCNPPLDDRYCPSRTVTRAEMAAFLIRAIGEEGNLPPYKQYFSDVPDGLWYTGYVERLYELGISIGYDDGTYLPDIPVSRAEMATFLSRAFNLPATTTDYFTDDAGSFFEPDINAVSAAGITKGCSADGTRYCPNDDVLRDQMASFLARALGIGA